MLIQIHVLQNYGPSNLNRDETGSPKDTMFGNVLRGRISSQCLKRSIRLSNTFRAAFEKDGLLGVRTKQLPTLIAEALSVFGANSAEMEAIKARVPEIGRESRKRAREEAVEGDEDAETQAAATEDATKQLIFLDPVRETKPLAEQLLQIYRKDPNKWRSIKIDEVTKQLTTTLPRSVDIAMFGRMTTSKAFKDVQAAVQVAHAISTHAVKQDFDYYTAMDDLDTSGEPGADMIGDVEFNSCAYYRYANVHWEQLLKNLGNDVEVARRGVLALLEAMVLAQPSGKQNTFAAHFLPDLVLVEVSQNNMPVNYANAFLEPARTHAGKSLMAASVEALARHIARLSKAYGLKPERAYMAVDDLSFLDLKPLESLGVLKTWLHTQLPV